MKSSGPLYSVILALVLAVPAFSQQLDPPEVSVVSAGRTSVTIQVRAGDSGAPDGFVVEWMPVDRYQALGAWSSSVELAGRAEFTGVPTLNPTPGLDSYRLGPGEVAEVVIGGLFDETGALATDPSELADGTEYIVRARATSDQADVEESNSSITLHCRTKPHDPTDCTKSAGYWKTHTGSWSRVDALTLGLGTYDPSQLLAILRQRARGNGLVSLAHQLIATRLNLLLGANPPRSVVEVVGEADAAIGALIVPPVGTGRLDPAVTAPWTRELEAFNTGVTGPGRCGHGVMPITTPTWGSLKTLYR
jgi:hypothetical protein